MSEWEELFALAEGKTSEEAEEAREHKRQKVDETDAMLASRSSTDLAVPEWLRIGMSFLAKDGKTCCKGWKSTKESSLYRSSCKRCHHVLSSHAVSLKSGGDSAWPHLLLCSVRNIRCAIRLVCENEVVESDFIGRDRKQISQTIQTVRHQYPNLGEKCDKIENQLAKLSNETITRYERWDEMIRSIIACDEVYYELYYLQITRRLPLTQNFLPHPPAYFGIIVTVGVQRSLDCIKNLMYSVREEEEIRRLEITARFGLDTNPEGEHPLAAVQFFRMIETVYIFQFRCRYKNETRNNESRKKSSNSEDELQRLEPSVLKEWRDSCRDFICHLYAFATVSKRSIKTFAERLQQYGVYEGVVEVGAGTGYMANILEECGIRVEAFDARPPSNTTNDYHGDTPSFFRVQTGTAKNFGNHKSLHSRALLLCYAQPKSPMALDALRRFTAKGGKLLIHIGEFKGFTGSVEFERYVASHMECIERFPCLTWGPDASEVTLWKLREHRGSESLLVPCIWCREKEAEKRCKFMRLATYCGESCFQSDRRLFDYRLRLMGVNQEIQTLSLANGKLFPYIKFYS